MADRPHLLLLMADQFQAQRLGIVDPVSRTPHLDRLADEGIRCTRAYTCHGQCVPARAALQTGQYAHECGVMVNYGFYGHQNRLGPQHVTFAHTLRDAGYRTVYIGKSHLGVPLDRLGYEESWVADTLKPGPGDVERLGIAYVPESLRSQYLALDRALDWLSRYRPDGRPLCFVFSTNLPNPPFFLEERFAGLFDPDALAPPASFHEETFAGKPRYQQEHVEDGVHGMTDEAEVRVILHQYLSMIAAVDDHCGRIIEAFRRLGLWDDTVAMFTADHGDMMAAHRMFKKGTIPYEELYRIPLLIRLPGGAAPGRRVIDDLVSSDQFAATLLEAAGIDPPASFHPATPWHALRRPKPPPDEAVFFEHYAAYWGLHPFYGIVTRQHKYVRYYGADDTEELYDLAADPHELHNLARDPACEAVRQRLARLADERWLATGGRDVAWYEGDAFRANRHNAWTDATEDWDSLNG